MKDFPFSRRIALKYFKSSDLYYLIVGMFNSRDWLQQSYGKKIMIAKEYQAERNHKVKIISESQWVK